MLNLNDEVYGDDNEDYEDWFQFSEDPEDEDPDFAFAQGPEQSED